MKRVGHWLAEPVDRLVLVIMFVTLCLVIGVVTYAGLKAKQDTNRNTAKISRNADKIGLVVHANHNQLIEGCDRLNILRAESNGNQLADYRVFKVVLTETVKTHRADPRFVEELQRAIDAKEWIPLTNCTRAVNTNGAAYKPPAPIPFETRLPPKSQL